MTEKEPEALATPAPATAAEEPSYSFEPGRDAREAAPDGAEAGAERLHEPAALAVEEEDPPFTPVNWTLIVVGLVLMAVGFLLLRQVNSDATNWQAIWAPMLILASYVVIFLGIIIVRGAPETDE